MEFKMLEQQRSEFAYAAVALVQQSQEVELLRLSKGLRFSDGRLEFGP